MTFDLPALRAPAGSDLPLLLRYRRAQGRAWAGRHQQHQHHYQEQKENRQGIRIHHGRFPQVYTAANDPRAIRATGGERGTVRRRGTAHY